MVRCMVLQLEPRPEAPTYNLTIFDLDDDEFVGWDLRRQCSREPLLKGLFDIYEGVEPWGDEGVSDLVDHICEAHEDWEDAEPFWREAQRHLVRR